MKGFLEFIENMQKKPESTRQAIATAIVAALTVIIISVWLSVDSIAPLNGVASAPQAIAAGSNEPSPFIIMWEMVKETVNTFR